MEKIRKYRAVSVDKKAMSRIIIPEMILREASGAVDVIHRAVSKRKRKRILNSRSFFW
ncbi:MAG: hypothetical protein ACE5IH_01710 [Thermodesulfobacteriota bacterium]